MKSKWMTVMLSLALVVGLFAVLPAPKALAATVTEWCFQDSGGAFTLTPNQGTGTAIAGSGITPNNFNGNASSSCVAGKAWAATDWTNSGSRDSGDYFEFSVSTVGKSGISFKFDHQRSNTGPSTFDLYYSTDGTTFVSFATGQSSPTGFTTNPMSTFNLSSITALDNNPNAKFRLYAYGASGSTGTWRIDNVLIENSGTLAVTLAEFSAQQVADHVRVAWETVSELDNRGFNLYRGVSPDGWDRQLNATLIPSQSQGNPGGFVYTWDDYADLVSGTTYYYWLEDVAISGATTLHGPVSVEFTAPTAVTLGGVAASTGLDTQRHPASGAAAAPALWTVVAAGLALGVSRLRRRG